MAFDLQAYRRNYYLKNKAKIIQGVRQAELRRLYDLTPAQFKAMFRRQHGKCALCLCKPKTRLVVDHDHTTNRVRGLLCDWCNRSLVTSRTTPAMLRRLLWYLSRKYDGRKA